MCLCWLFSRCGEWGLLQLQCAGFSLQWLPLLWTTGSRAHGLPQWQHVGLVAPACGLEHRLGSRGAEAQLLRRRRALPRPGIQPVSPAVAGRSFTPEPSGKALHCCFDSHLPSEKMLSIFSGVYYLVMYLFKRKVYPNLLLV